MIENCKEWGAFRYSSRTNVQAEGIICLAHCLQLTVDIAWTSPLVIWSCRMCFTMSNWAAFIFGMFLSAIIFNCKKNLMFIGPCIIVIVEEWKTILMSLAILFHFLCAQHVLDINISIIRSLRLCWWVTTSVVLFSVRCMLELLVRLVLGSASACKTNHGYINVRNMLST